ncbi:MAG: hypothetical protein Q8P86_01820 [bacterium]|nr:hypothetical protein [bacterium]
MPNVEFNDENQYTPMQSMGTGSVSGLTGWLIKIGVAKDVTGANKILLGIAVVSLIVAVVVFWRTTRSPELIPITPEPGLGQDIPGGF